MKRDLNLIRMLLLKIEGEEDIEMLEKAFSEQYGGKYDQICYTHIELMSSAGLIKASSKADLSGHYAKPKVAGITWSGYEYLDSVRDSEVWWKTKS